MPSPRRRVWCRRGGRSPGNGFTLIEVLVASVILFAGVGAVLKAYSSAVSVLAAASDLLNSTLLLKEKAVEWELRAVSGMEPLQGGGGQRMLDSVAYAWDVECRRQSLSPDAFIQNASIRVCRAGSSPPHVLECEWLFIREPSKTKDRAP